MAHLRNITRSTKPTVTNEASLPPLDVQRQHWTCHLLSLYVIISYQSYSFIHLRCSSRHQSSSWSHLLDSLALTLALTPPPLTVRDRILFFLFLVRLLVSCLGLWYCLTACLVLLPSLYLFIKRGFSPAKIPFQIDTTRVSPSFLCAPSDSLLLAPSLSLAPTLSFSC